MTAMDEVDHTTQCVYCQVGDCDYLALGYPYCHGCHDHHRQPVAAPGERCPVDLSDERAARNLAAGRESCDDGHLDVIVVPPRTLG